ncbi:hypothetical protein BO94DRAFT_617809 [Aspergillus sclerotioniger CBS 115572]|uniref:Uncharacterized protein n=1 Tax=Aspergillus sclerotioniger CBS 115572 TaxID=1450535 RepID=A0A317WXY1_9EURO|nr:hypothetical protein BO94DRAFT_617809 [Aspergillus sclerotioniger CBS 115572]PWY91296.1 hypothetical protein BO94DRAFT_617809 [Aspergillus sclerotioniger CBS 115572]
MLFQPLSILLLTAGAHLASSTSLASNITILGPDDLHQSIAETFLICLNAINIPYRLYVDAGTTTILPLTNRTIDTTGTDAPLLDCMMSASNTMNLAAEDTTYSNENHAISIPATEATYAWLLKHSAQGLHPIGSKPSIPMATHKRSLLHYWSYLSDYSECTSEDFHVSYTNDCHNWWSAYKSVQFENPSGSEYLHLRIWPHHKCSQGNSRTVIVAPMKLHACVERTTYSYYGRYVKCNC